MKVENTRGKVFYGMHFCPGVARYEPPGEEPFTIFINESVIRKMGPGFAGCPIFVEHIEGEIEEDLDTLKNEADGWVMESFYNAADGKTWAKFIVTSKRGLAAIEKGWKLSNAYIPQCVEQPGQWNGVPYDRMVVNGEFEHLAIVQHPRYEESEIMSPEQFKAYNEKKTVELKRLANSKDKGEKTMKLNIFKRQKVENSVDLDGLVVELPKCKKEVLLTKVVDEYDKILNMNGYANGDHMVKVGDKDEMSVNDLVKAHMDMKNEFEAFKAKNEATDEGGEPGDDGEGIVNADDEDDPAVDNSAIEGSDMGDVGDRGGDESLNNDEDEDEDDKKKTKNTKTKNELEVAKRKKLAKEKALRLRNAHLREPDEEAVTIALPQEQVARGQNLYGSGN